MARLHGTVWIAELDRQDPVRGGTIWSGRFRAHHDRGGTIGGELTDADAAEAIAWGRSRAPLVWIRLADGDYLAAGSGHAGWARRWDPARAVHARRPPGEEWRDRPEDAARIAWAVEVDLSPPYREPRPDWEDAVARIAARGGASGWRAARILGEPRAGEAWFAAGDEDVSGRAMLVAPYAGPHAGLDLTTYRLSFRLDARTAEHAMEYGIDRCLVPAGWSAVAWARPVG